MKELSLQHIVILYLVIINVATFFIYVSSKICQQYKCEVSQDDKRQRDYLICKKSLGKMAVITKKCVPLHSIYEIGA